MADDDDDDDDETPRVFVVENYDAYDVKRKFYDVNLRKKFSSSASVWRSMVKHEGTALAHAPLEHKKNLSLVLTAVSNDGHALEYAPDEMKNNPQVVEAALKEEAVAMRSPKKPKRYHVASAHVIRNSVNAMVAWSMWKTGRATELEYGVFGCASHELRNNEEFVRDAVRENGWALGCASDEMKDNSRVVVSAIRPFESMGIVSGEEFHFYAMQYASDNLRDNEGFLVNALYWNGLALKYASDAMRNNGRVVVAAIKTICPFYDGVSRQRMEPNACAMQYASDNLKSNEDFLVDALNWNGLALEFASMEMKNNERVVVAAITPFRVYGRIDKQILESEARAMQYASYNLKNNENFLVDALKHNGLALEFASMDMKDSGRVVVAAIKPFPFSDGFSRQQLESDARAMQYASDNLKNNENFLVNALYWNGLALEFASMEMKNNRRVVIAAIKPCPEFGGINKQLLESDARVMQYASDNLKNNENFLVDALKHNGLALEFASWYMRNNQRVVMAAIKPCKVFGRINKQRLESDARAMQYASDNLRDDEDFLVDALKHNGLALEFASWYMRNNQRVVMAAITPPTDRRAKSVAPAIEHASEELKSDPRFWQRAVKTNGFVLGYSTEPFENDVDVAIEAVRRNRRVSDSVPDRIRENERYLSALFQIFLN